VPVGVTPGERRSRIESERRRVEETIAALEQKNLFSPIRDTALGLGSLGVALGSIVRSKSNGA
jgi:hypothetical protein